MFSDKVRRIYPDARILMFGSCARGTASADSDLDLCVVLPHVQPDDRFAISDIAWEISLEHNRHLSTVVVPAEDFERGPVSASPFLDAVLCEVRLNVNSAFCRILDTHPVIGYNKRT